MNGCVKLNSNNCHDKLKQELMRKMDNIWRTKLVLEKECRILFQKLYAMPELEDNRDENDNSILDNKTRSTLFKRIKYHKLLALYKNTLLCCEAFGYRVRRSHDGKHELEKFN